MPIALEATAFVRAWLPQLKKHEQEKLNQRVLYIPIDFTVKIKLKLTRPNKKIELNLNKETTIKEILKKINLKPDTIIVLIKNKPVPIDKKIKTDQELTLMQITSGG